jgi:hypothetical protein
MDSNESRRAAFRESIKDMTTDQLKRLSNVLKRSTDDVIEELTVLQEKLQSRDPQLSPLGAPLAGDGGAERPRRRQGRGVDVKVKS